MNQRRTAEITELPEGTLDRLMVGRATDGDQMLARNAILAYRAQEAITQRALAFTDESMTEIVERECVYHRGMGVYTFVGENGAETETLDQAAGHIRRAVDWLLARGLAVVGANRQCLTMLTPPGGVP